MGTTMVRNDNELIAFYRMTLRRIARSARETHCDHIDCTNYGMRPLSVAMQQIAADALEGKETP